MLEDNDEALQLALKFKRRLQSKNACVKYYYFRQSSKNNKISMQAIETDYQQADIMITPLHKENFEEFRNLVMGWQCSHHKM